MERRVTRQKPSTKTGGTGRPLVVVETPLEAGGGAIRHGVLRLLKSLASRDSCSAQDDREDKFATRMIAASLLGSRVRLVVDIHYVLD